MKNWSENETNFIHTDCVCASNNITNITQNETI